MQWRRLRPNPNGAFRAGIFTASIQLLVAPKALPILR